MTRRPPKEMAEILGAMANAKANWINAVSSGKNRRSPMDIALAQRDLSALRQAADAYHAASLRGENTDAGTSNI